MGNLSESQLGTVRTLIKAASDNAIRDLQQALSAGGEQHETMRLIQKMVMDEGADRRGRDNVFAPLLPLCSTASRGPGGLLFPPMTLARLWRGLREETPAAVAAAVAVAGDLDPPTPPGEMYDALCLQAAVGLRARSNPGYGAAAAGLDQAHPEGAALFATYLDLTPVGRSALERMPEWLGRLNEERSVAARLTFRDAVAVAEDAGPRLLEILYGHLEEPWSVLRLISAVMHHPSDRFVATTELASFGERLMDDVDEKMKRVAAFNADNGPSAGKSAGEDVRTAAMQIGEFDECFDLAPDGPWGARLTRQKRALSQTVENRLKAVDNEVAAAVPVVSAGFKARGARGQPRLTQDPDERQVNRALGFLTLLQDTRTAADKLGFGSLWAKAVEAVESRLQAYSEDLLYKLKDEDQAEFHDRARLYLEVAAQFMGLAAGEKAGQIIRRRLAAAKEAPRSAA